MGLLSGFSKGLTLSRISQRLAPSADPVADFHVMLDAQMAGRTPPHDQALSELLDFCFADRELRPILASHNVDRTQLKEIYNVLTASGAGQWVRGYFVAACALAYPETLAFLLRQFISGNTDGTALDSRRIAHQLIRHFQNGRRADVALR